MKYTVYTLLLLTVLIVLPFTSCKKDQHYMNDAVITGEDTRMCVCCGGLMINFNNDPDPNPALSYLIENNPASIGIADHAAFPIYVSIDWSLVPLKCNGRYINISRIRILR